MSAPRVSYAVGRLDRAVSAALARCVAPHGLTLPQYTALSLLGDGGGLSNAQLARRSFVRPQSMQQVVAVLERDGLIRRSPDPSHGRILRTALTASGSAVLAACDAAVDAFEAQMLADLAADERARLTDALQACTQRVEVLEQYQPG